VRLWSLNPSYLDQKGLTALWREALLAKKVLENKTKAYLFHPQLIRFRESYDAHEAINFYLAAIHDESAERGYRFDAGKFSRPVKVTRMSVTSGQLFYETEHLKRKLIIRNPQKHKELIAVSEFLPHPLFYIIDGNIEEWEKIR